MDHHIGFAFSVEQISYAVFESPDMVLCAAGITAYPFDYEEGRFLQQEARISLTSVLKNILDEQKLSPKSISFSIESNLVVLKRIVYPENLEESGITDHISWHIAESLNLPMNEYALVRSDNIIVREGLKEELVISIQKKLIRFFREIADALEIPLRNLTVHHLSAELALNSALADQAEKLMILFKIAHSRYESSFFLNGRYYKSHYERLPARNSSSEYETNLIQMVKQEAAYIENQFLTGDQEQILVDRILIYGPGLNESFLSMIQKNMSIPVDRFNPLQNIVISESLQSVLTDEIASEYVECVGVSLDQ